MNKILKVTCFILFALLAGINTIYAQGQSPTGLVVDENGQPMIGVQIKIEGTTVGAITDVDGNFTIKATKGNILIFSYVATNNKKSLIREKRYWQSRCFQVRKCWKMWLSSVTANKRRTV